MADQSLASLSMAERIDSACDRFEDDGLKGRSPRIEEFLKAAPESERPALWRALVLVELELIARSGGQPEADDYRRRFPEYAEQVDAVFAESAKSPPRRPATPNPSASAKSKPPAKPAGGNTAQLSSPGANTSINSAAADQAAPAKPLERLGRFEILAVLGEGGFGTVYRARDPHLDREVAVKVPREGLLQSPEARERFLREARAAANLSHPNICPVHEVGQIEGHDYIVMEYVAGKPLSKIIESGKLQARQAAAAVRKLAIALHEAHQKGIVHRDLKPANIIVNTRGEPVVMDFGLARLHKPGDAQITQSGTVMGSPSYMSPEQARGATDEITPASDIYSLGVVLYELLTGQRPFMGTVTEVIGKILHVEPDAPSKHRPNLDRRLEAICLKAMAKKRSDRYRSMKEFAQALGEYLKSSAPSGATASIKTVASRTPTQTAKDSGSTQHVAEMFARVSAGLQSQAKELGQRHTRLVQVVLAGFAVVALLVLSGIWFFARNDSVTVVINIPIDTSDPALSFFLDARPIAADELAAPIELKPGDHELVVNKNDVLFKKFRFRVGKDKNQQITVRDVTPTPPGPPQPARVAAAPETPLDTLDPASIPAKERFPWQPQELVAVFGEHRSTHWGTVHTIAVSPDDTLVASGGEDGFIHLSDPTTLEHLGTLNGHEGPVHSLAFVPGRNQIVSAGADGTLRLWDVPARREIRKLTGHTGPVYTVAVLPDGTQALSGGSDASIRLWDLATGDELRKFDKATKAVWKIVLPADGQRVLSGGDDRNMRFWSLETGEDLVQFEIEWSGYNEFKPIAISPDGSRAFSGSSQGEGKYCSMRIWDTATGKVLRRTGPDYKVQNDGHGAELKRAGAAAISPDGTQVLTGIDSPADGNDLIIWDIRNGDVVRRFGKQATFATAVAWSPDGRRAYTGSQYGRLRAWDAESGADLVPFAGHESFVSSVALAPNSLSLLTGGEDLTVRLWNTLDQPRERQVYRAAEPWTAYSAAWRAEFSPDGNEGLFRGGVYTEDRLLLWDTVNWSELRNLGKEWKEPVYSAVFTPDGQGVFAGLKSGAVLWTRGRPESFQTMPGPTVPTTSVAYASMGRAVSAGHAKTARLWDMWERKELKQVGPFPGETRVAASADHIAVAVAGDASVRLYNIDQEKVDLGGEVVLDAGAGAAMAFSLDGATFATANRSGHIALWSPSTGEKLREFKFPGAVHSLAFDTTGRYLVTGNANGTAYLLRLAGPGTGRLAPQAAKAQPDDGFVSLFNGKDLTGWKTHSAQPGGWSVEEGLLTGRSDQPHHLFSERGDFQDFHLRAEVRVNAGGNSGLFFRSEFGLNRVPGKFPAGYEAQILLEDPPVQGNTTGSLKYFAPGKDTAIKANEWVLLEVTARGDRITIKVDGITTVDFVDPNKTYARGHFAIQVMGPGSVVQFRKIEVKDLSVTTVEEADFVPLFNGKDLTGWQGRLELWSLRDGVLTGRPVTGNKNSFLFSPRPFKDFELRFQVRVGPNDNSGVQIRSDILDRNDWTALGPQCDLGNRPGDLWGGVYGENVPGGWLLKPEKNPPVKANDWNDYFVRCIGRRVTIQVNGTTTVDGEWAELQESGLLGFQIHAKNQQPVEFRNLLVREHPEDSSH